jgi:transcriptional regulator with XRE-family HTH domain
MSQASLAEAMTEQGFPWHQATVSRIESGTQPLSLDETAALAAVFGVEVGSFLPPRAIAS